MRSGTELVRGIQLTDRSTAGEQGWFLWFRPRHHWRNLFHFHDGKKSSSDRPNHTSIQVFHFKISVKIERRKQIRFDKQLGTFLVTSIQFVACALREKLSNRSSGVQIPRDICTRFGRYLYSTK